MFPTYIHAQVLPDSTDTEIVSDTSAIKGKPESTGPDSLFNPILTDPVEPVRISKDSLDAIINYGAQDTQWYDHKTGSMHLYGDAYVNYEQMKLSAGYIIFDMEKDIASAFSIKDEHGHDIQLPTFDDGERTFTYDKLQYNFKKKKGIVYDAITTESGLYVHGSKTKYVSGGQDSLNDRDIIYNKDAVITSCNHPDPHFGIRASKMKVVTNRVAVIGPSNLELAGVPTPLWLPFGFFPLTDGESTGFIFPDDYRYSPDKGFGFEGMGWYFPLNDYINLIIKGDYYTNGTHGINVTSNYKKKYKYNGGITLRYNNRFEENSEAFLIPNRSFAVGINHSQDAKAHPYMKIGGSVNFQLNSYSATVYNDANSVLNNVYTSNFSFSHSLPRTPFTFSAAFRHRQNTAQETIDVTFPDIQLRMNTIYPFKRKNASGTDEKWYEKINIKYNSDFKNSVSTTDSIFLTNEVWDELRSGVGNSASAGASFRVLKYFNIVPSATANANYLFQSRLKELEVDTSGIARINSSYQKGLTQYYDYRIGTSINTQVFASLPATRGWFRGYRHTIKPRLDFTYARDTRDAYEERLITGTEPDDFTAYSPFERAAISVPGLQDLQGRVDFAFGGTVEMKYYSRKDSTEKKIKLLDNLNFSSGYNVAVDSFQFKQPTLGGTSRMFNGISTFTFGLRFDPYKELENGRVDQFVYDGNPLEALRFDDAFVKLTTGIKVKQIISFINKKNEKKESNDSRGNNDKKTGYEPISLASWFESLTLNHDVQYNFTTEKGLRENTLRANTLRLSGTIPLTEKWKLTLGNISYDFKNDKLVYPTFQLSRNLHCWDMRFSWAPSRGTYSFFIGVSNSNLNFLKYDYGRSNLDGFSSRFP